ncbi:hypothetical protein [uncultured Cytophaga sp.]|uniref:hypothetical protein n=1 Tax=uncultured Cytophaga sp. TaxID=160238 RepID=UPI0026380C99|nr:hypothetical protein [uncultured Cytophaga sp.]
MKVQYLFYFILFFVTLFSGCKKGGVEPNTIIGKWYVERYTVYDSDGGPSSGYYSYEPKENYESVGVFNFKANGKGIYLFENQEFDFFYSISENGNTNNGSSSSFNGISTNSNSVNENTIVLEFDKSAITTLNSPIIANYYLLDVTKYELYSKTSGMLRFRTSLNKYSSNAVSNTNNVEFILTKQ